MGAGFIAIPYVGVIAGLLMGIYQIYYYKRFFMGLGYISLGIIPTYYLGLGSIPALIGGLILMVFHMKNI